MIASLLGEFVTAKLKGEISPRQGWVVSLDPLKIQGQSGEVYECEGTPVKVINPPQRDRRKEKTFTGYREIKRRLGYEIDGE